MTILNTGRFGIRWPTLNERGNVQSFNLVLTSNVFHHFSPHATGELFEELKKGRDEPDPAKAAGVTVDAADEFNTEKYNPTIMDFLTKLPGVTTKNVFALMNRVEDMEDLLNRSLEDLTEILGHSSNAKELLDSLHGNLLPLDEQNANQKVKSKGTSRFKSGKSKAQAAK